jgi:hypothetical protein
MSNKNAKVTVFGELGNPGQVKIPVSYEITVSISWSERSELIAAALAELAGGIIRDEAKLNEVISKHIAKYLPGYGDPA